MPKADLVFAKPVMNAAGTLGFAPDGRAPVPWSEFGAFVTNPISWRSRAVTRVPAMLTYPGGFVLHTGLPNPGFGQVTAKYSRRWSESVLPIVVHLIGDRPEEARAMTRQLEALENILAIELSFAPLLSDDIILLAIEMCQGELPLIACLPREQVLRLGPRAVDAGAAAVSLAAPRGALKQEGHLVTGRLYGASLLPAGLELVRAAARIGVPCIGAGGVRSKTDQEAMLAAGAIAAQLDSTLWLPHAEAESRII